MHILILYSPFVHVAKRVADDTFLPQAFPLGHGTVWPGYGYPTMDDGDEFAHGWLRLC